MVRAGLGYLTACDAAGLSTAAQAEALMGLERAEAQHTAARARVLTAFTAQRGFEADGQYGARPWLRAFTKVTKGAAGAAAGWARRLSAHPVIAAALAAAQIPASLARQICDWTDQLPADLRGDADGILLAAVLGGADQCDLARLAREMIERSQTGPDRDNDRFDERALWLETTFDDAGRLHGDLTPACAAALAVVLDALGRKTGPEDTRTMAQRRHDAIEEACARLISGQMIPGRDGQPPHLQVHVDLGELRGQPGASLLERGWSAARAAAGPGSVYLTGHEAEAAACDAVLTTIVAGHIDWQALEHLTDLWLALRGHDTDSPRDTPATHPATTGDGHASPRSQLSAGTRAQLAATLLQASIDVVSGPGGPAAYLRTALLGVPFSNLSQPLDIGRATRTIPPHLRHAVILRDKHCRFPGCHQPPSVCDVHHLHHWTHGGPTRLGNLGLYCRFHHQVVIHRWGWKITQHPDGTTTATAPDGRTLHSHSPPQHAA